MRTVLALILVLAAAAAAARTDTMTGIFDERIKSLQLRLNDDAFALPVIIMGTPDRLQIDFDELADDRTFFRASLTHCNADWQPSQMMESEFVEGFNETTVENYEFSNATTVPYVHYSLSIPDDKLIPKISGNYLLKIYREDEPDSPVAQCRFMVSESSVPVAVDISSRTDIDFNKEHQQVAVMVDIEHAMVDDPFNDLLVTVNQNGRLDSETSVRQPLRVSGSRLFYEHNPALIFEAGNEYRRFETVSTTFPGMGVDAIEFFHPYYHFRLHTDSSRADENYTYDSTQHGRYFIREYNSDHGDTDADYGIVHFTLDFPAEPGDMIFIDGDIVQRRFDENSRMTFNPNTGLYERAMLLKQGAYNYRYLIVPRGARRGYTGAIEGDKFQTVNEYNVKIYHRRRGERYDRLIGTASATSH